MKKIILILFSLLICSLFSSCNTTKRAEKRIYNIVEDHQELLKQDTVKIDTVLSIKPAADSAIFDLDTIVENQTHTIRTERGEFGITILPSKEVKIIIFLIPSISISELKRSTTRLSSSSRKKNGGMFSSPVSSLSSDFCF